MQYFAILAVKNMSHTKYFFVRRGSAVALRCTLTAGTDLHRYK